ncbi:hypothetical protein HK098_006937 [Nowakowskiella sp. JEL0407]|nr:hypothetical protein HK098_006937 [Nowakowskiella sp. JEL0407]
MSSRSPGRQQIKKSNKEKERSRENLGSAGESRISKMVNATPEIVYKMSKKIAQLTKVIYFLNTKNEDNMLEIQNLNENFENEMNEMFENSKSRFEEITQQNEEFESKCRAQEAVIESYMEKIESLQQEIRIKESNESQLHGQIKLLHEEQRRMQEQHKYELDDAVNKVEVGKQDEELIALRNHYEARIKRIIEDHENSVTDINRRFVGEIEEMKVGHTKKIKQLTEDRQKTEDSVKSTVNALKARHDDEMRVLQQEQRKLKMSMEEKDREARDAFEQMEKKLSDTIREEQARVTEKTRLIKEMTEELSRKSTKIRELERILADEIEFKKKTELNLQSTTQKLEKCEKSLDLVSTMLKVTESKLSGTEDQLNRKTVELSNTLTALTDLRDEFDKLTSAHSISNTQLDNALIEINRITTRIKQLEIEANELIALRDEKEKELKELNDALIRIQKKQTDDINNALSKLRQELESKHKDEMSKTLKNLYTKHSDEISKLEKNIEELNKAMEAQMEEFKTTLKRNEEENEKTVSGLKLTIKDFELERDIVNVRMSELTQGLEFQTSEANKHAATIQVLQQTVHILETDKADLFQKMQFIDEQTRAEMTDKFYRDKMEIEEEWQRKANFELKENSEKLEKIHLEDLKAMSNRLDQVHRTELEQIRNHYTEKINSLEAEKTTLNQDLVQAEEFRKEVLKQLLETREANVKEISNLKTEFETTMSDEKKKWEEAATAKETQLKVSSTLALAALEKKHQAEMDEIDASYKKQMEELRNFHTLNSLAAKKDAETLRQEAITRLRVAHMEEIEKLNDEHSKKITEVTVNLNIQKSKELKELQAKRDRDRKLYGDTIMKLESEIKDRVATEKVLNSTIREQEFDMTQLRDIIKNRDRDIAKLREENLEYLSKQEQQLAEIHRTEIEKLNEEHISQAQTMLKEFELAQGFLKKQISTHVQQLKEADLRYANREPREVDLQRISQLEEDIKKKKRKIAALTDEIGYYKLEMNNREANFNRIFNQTPKVGIIEPTKKKGERDKRLPPLSQPTHSFPQAYSISRSRSSSIGSLNEQQGQIAPAATGTPSDAVRHGKIRASDRFASMNSLPITPITVTADIPMKL